MTTMTGMQREAIRRAQRGDWDLADAMEIQLQCNHDDLSEGDEGCAGGLRSGGRLRYLVFTVVDPCEVCLGTGRTGDDEDPDSVETACADCGGAGVQCRSPTRADEVRIETLEGVELDEEAADRVWRGCYFADVPKPFLTPQWARDVIDDYQQSLSAPAQGDIPNLPRAA